ncbi:MAG: GNAT family N-acetyltransferase [Hyphomicrobiales bacterium]|nr:MAG: GNAT family N-acetyltransferase [Hyphomicrobiales bacterium]
MIEPHDAVLIRQATKDDAPAISAVVIKTLRETNVKFYTADMIDAVATNFSVDQVEARMAERVVFVATIAGNVVGTASLHQGTVRTVFVLPDRQGRRIGSTLMARILDVAREQGLDSLTVPSAINAESFYQKLGFVYLSDKFEGSERIIIMRKELAPTERGTEAPC